MKRTRAGVVLCSPFNCAGVVFSQPLRTSVNILQRYRFCTESSFAEILIHYIE